MAKISVFDMAGQQVSEMELSDAVFGITPNEAVLHAMVVNYLANQRQGTQSTLTRTEVRGGGRKPWRQKGTGHARQGSIRAPQWTHGGVALGPKPRDYRYTLNKKVRKLGMKSALSAKVQDGNLIVLDRLACDEFKTKTVVNMLNALNATGKALLVTAEADRKVIKTPANIPGGKAAAVNTLNVYDILHYDKFIVSKDAVAKIENRNEYAYILSHEFGLFLGRAFGLLLFIFLAYCVSQDFALKYALVIVAGLQLAAYPLAKNITNQTDTIEHENDK